MRYIKGFLMAWGCFCRIPCPYRGWEELKKREEKVFSAIEDKFVFIQHKFGVTVPPEEISYLVELFLAEMAQ